MKYLKIYEEFDHLNRWIEPPVYKKVINKLEGNSLLNMGKYFTIMFDADIEKCRDGDYNGINGFNEQADILFHTNSADSDDSFEFRDEWMIDLYDEPHTYNEDLLSVYREVLLEVIEQIIYMKGILGEENPFDKMTGDFLKKI